ncbi:MAG TPA: hypothetical protein VK181_09010 [Rhizobium sp.]|nr:hypothetical protein [Rhizobium sp.]
MTSTVRYSSVRDPKWSDSQKTSITCWVKFDHCETEVPFTASPADVEPHGQEIFSRCSSGEFGLVSECDACACDEVSETPPLPVEMQELQKYLDEANKENAHGTERGTVLVWASILDEMLTKLLKSFLIPLDKGKLDEIFEPDGPLSTFSAKTKIAFAVGLITKEEADCLNSVRKIRNDFAHKIGETLTQPPHVDRCRTLCIKLNGKIDMREPRHWFSASCCRLLLFLSRRVNEAAGQGRRELHESVPLRERQN